MEQSRSVISRVASRLQFSLSAMLLGTAVICLSIGLSLYPSQTMPHDASFNLIESEWRSWGWPFRVYYEFDRGFIWTLNFMWWDAAPEKQVFSWIGLIGNIVVAVSAVLCICIARELLRPYFSRVHRLIRPVARSPECSINSGDVSATTGATVGDRSRTMASRFMLCAAGLWTAAVLAVVLSWGALEAFGEQLDEWEAIAVVLCFCSYLPIGPAIAVAAGIVCLWMAAVWWLQWKTVVYKFKIGAKRE
jgi:hypothetical protein